MDVDVTQVVGLSGGSGTTRFEVLGIEGEGTTKYYPAVVDGIERSWMDFRTFDDYLAHKVERERRTVRLNVAGNAVVAEDAVSHLLGCKAMATSPKTVDVYPDQPLVEPSNAAASLGRIGGISTSAAKAAAARINGRKGGRPRKEATQ